MANVTLINPNVVLQKNDPFTTGIIYMPISLAYFAASVKKAGHGTTVIDAFGENPNQIWSEENFLIRGLLLQETLKKVPANTDIVVIYAINLTYHRSLISIVTGIKKIFPNIKIVVLENSQAVTAYSLRKVKQEFYNAGADFIITGEGEIRGLELIESIEAKNYNKLVTINGIGGCQTTHYADFFNEPTEKIQNLDELPLPAWDLFPIKKYWSIGYAHGPLTSKKYLPLLTSRGCPYKCKFCVIPETNDLKWRARSAKNVVDEIEFFKNKFGVEEFHIEDVDPTISDKRTQDFSLELINRNLNITWKICSGTKVETIKSTETIDLMHKSGCRYISISPESGSSKVMKLMDKTFNYEHAIHLVNRMNKVGIKSQACYVLGYPGEDDADRELTRTMVVDLIKNGLDEIALFIVTPVPGSKIYNEFSGYSDYSQLNFSPTWREDYVKLNQFRLKLYRTFLINKTLLWPLKIFRQCLNFLTRKFETKMEMAPYRALHTKYINLIS